MIVSLLALFSGTITFENPGIRLELFLKELSRQSQITFRCPAYLKDEVIAASFKDQSVDILKAQLARVIHATWEKRDDAWQLVQTPEQKKEEQQWHHDLRRLAIQQFIDGGKAKVPTKEWTIQDAELYQRQLKEMRNRKGEHRYTTAERKDMYTKSAESRFVASFLAQLKPEMFPLDAQVEDYQLYTVNGAGLGQDLPLDLQNSLGWLDREMALTGLVSEHPVRESQSKRVIFNLTNRFPVDLSLSVYDERWRFVSLPVTFFFLPTYKTTGEAFPLSPSLQSYFDAIKLGPPAGNDDEEKTKAKAPYLPIWTTISNTFLNAIVQDPLGIEEGRCWIEFAASKNMPLLVNLEDDSFQETKYHVPTLEQDQTVFSMIRDDHEGWVLGRPANPFWNRSHRINRELVQQAATIFHIPEEKRTIEEQVVLIDIGKFASEYCSGIPNENFLSTPVGEEENTVTQIYGACVRAGVSPNPRTGIIEQSAMPYWARLYLLHQYVSFSLGGLIPDDRSEECPEYLLAKSLKDIYLKVDRSPVPTFEYKDSDGDIALYDFTTLALVIKDAMDNKLPVDQISFKVGLRQHVDISICLGNKSISNELDGPVRGDLKPTTWGNLDASLKLQVLDAIQRLKDLPPPLAKK